MSHLYRAGRASASPTTKHPWDSLAPDPPREENQVPLPRPVCYWGPRGADGLGCCLAGIGGRLAVGVLGAPGVPAAGPEGALGPPGLLSQPEIAKISSKGRARFGD